MKIARAIVGNVVALAYVTIWVMSAIGAELDRRDHARKVHLYRSDK